MKKILPSLSLLFFSCILHANTYYSTNSAAPNVVGSWHTSRNGTGTSPANFTNTGDIFIVQAGQYITTTANWNISGTNSELLVETGATFEADDKVTVSVFEIDGTGIYIHNKSTNNFPGTDTRTFATTSTVEIEDWSGTAALPSPTTWGNLVINISSGYSGNWNQAGGLTDIAGNFDIKNTGSSNEFRLATTQDYNLTIEGDLIIENGTLEAGQSNGNHTQVIILNGSYTQSGGTFVRSNTNANTLQVQFNGTNSNFTMTGGTLTDTYMDWIVNGSAKLTLNNNLPVAASRSFTVNGTLDCSTQQVTGAGTFTLASGGSLSTSSSSGTNGAIVVTGSAVYNSGASYQFNAATTSPFPSSGGSVSASNVTVNANVTLNKDVTLSGTLTMSSGILTIPAGNTIIISSGNAISGSGFGTSKQIATLVNTGSGAKGVVRMSNLTGSTTLPVGTGTYYLPVTLTVSTANDFSVTVFQGATANGAPNGTPFGASQKAQMVDAVWIVNRNSGANTVSMTLTWPSALEGSAFQSLADNQIGIAHNGGYWEAPLGTGSQSQNTATRTGITSFSPFGVGQIGTPLPLKFGEIKVYEQSGGNLNIDWVSYNEINLNHFEIQRSSNGQQFTTIGRVAARNNDSRFDYNWTDASPLNGASFYRIDGIDIDGRSNYSTIVKIDLSQADSELTLYPNPVSDGHISLQAGNMNKGSYKLTIANLYGRIIYSQTFDHPGGVVSQVVQLPVATAPGMYSLSLAGNNVKFIKQFVVR